MPGLDYSVVVAQAPITNTTVYVGGVTPDVTEQMVRVAMAEYGSIEEIRIQPGFVFVKYRTHEQAAKAIVGMTGKMIAGRVVKVSEEQVKM